MQATNSPSGLTDSQPHQWAALLSSIGRPQTHHMDKQTLSLINGLLSWSAYNDLELWKQILGVVGSLSWPKLSSCNLLFVSFECQWLKGIVALLPDLSTIVAIWWPILPLVTRLVTLGYWRCQFRQILSDPVIVLLCALSELSAKKFHSGIQVSGWWYLSILWFFL